jgi:hypothetical protein
MTFMTACLGELKAGKFSIYGQWMGWLSMLLCICVGFGSIGYDVIFGVISVVEGFFLVLLEVTFITKFLRGTDKLIALSQNQKMKTGLYILYYYTN